MNALIAVGDPGHIGENECLQEQEHCESNQSATTDPRLGSLVQTPHGLCGRTCMDSHLHGLHSSRSIELASMSMIGRSVARCPAADASSTDAPMLSERRLHINTAPAVRSVVPTSSSRSKRTTAVRQIPD